jgi:hypothetical protein
LQTVSGWDTIIVRNEGEPADQNEEEKSMEIEKVRLGRTGLMVTKTAFGALPVQRIGHADAKKLLRRAYDSGINYFDTANAWGCPPQHRDLHQERRRR